MTAWGRINKLTLGGKGLIVRPWNTTEQVLLSLPKGRIKLKKKHRKTELKFLRSLNHIRLFLNNTNPFDLWPLWIASSFSLQYYPSTTFEGHKNRGNNYWQKKFDCQTNSPHLHIRKCTKNSMENMQTDAGVLRV